MTPFFAVGTIDAPLVRLRVVEAQSQSLDVSSGTIEFDLLADGASIPDFARATKVPSNSTQVFDPVREWSSCLTGTPGQSRSRAGHPAPT